jgi:hypothetical protein
MKARSLFAVALAAVLVPALATAAPRSGAQPASRGSMMNSLWAGGFLGYETDDLDGIALRADVEVPFTALAPQVNLSWVGSLGYSRLTDDLPGNIDVTANIFKIIPAARFSFPVAPQLTIFADAGLGLYYANIDVDRSPFFGTGFDDDELSIMMRFGGGAWFDVNERTRIGAAIEFDPYFGDFDQTTFILQAGVMFRL